MKKFVLANGILIDKVNNLCYEKKDILVEKIKNFKIKYYIYK